jgi:membrane dipeptidase
VALGSDFNNAMMPEFIGNAAGLPKLIAAMQAAGYGAELIEKLTWKNWLSLIRRTLG